MAGSSKFQDASDPALRFLMLFKAALATGAARVADRRGGPPIDAERWGWRAESGGGWAPHGTRIGWLDRNDVLLDPEASHAVAQRVAGSERLPLGAQALRQRLAAHGLLASVDRKRETLTVRRVIEGRSRNVLHLSVRALWDGG